VADGVALLLKDEKDGLSDVFGEVWVFDLTERGGVDHIEVAADEFIEGEAGAGRVVLLQECVLEKDVLVGLHCGNGPLCR
jgi:hypothetical protein